MSSTVLGGAQRARFASFVAASALGSCGTPAPGLRAPPGPAGHPHPGRSPWRWFHYPEPALDNAVLDRREQALVQAVADAFFPPGGPIPLSGCDAGVLAYFDRYLARSDPHQRLLMRLLLLFTELSPMAFGPTRRPFTQLDQGQRLVFLQSASKSRIYFRRVAFVSFRALMTMAYLANADVARHMGMVADADPFRASTSTPR